MNSAGWLFFAIFIAYLCAAIAPLPRHHFRGSTGICMSWCFVPIIFICPIFIPSDHVGMRAASAFISGDIFFKLVDDLQRGSDRARSLTRREYFRFLIPFPILCTVYPDHKRRLTRPESPWPQVLRLIGGILGCTLAVVSIIALSETALIRSSFALNHVVMLLTFVLAIESLSRALCGLERLAGFDTTPIVRNAYLSRTVSEFWRRYNGRVHDWFYRNVFLATGGRRTPVRSLLLVFFASGVFHEVMFAQATSRLTGYQFAFFMLQGPATLVSGPFERLASRGGIAGKLMAHGMTMIFMAVTSILFFNGVSEVFPFIYASQSPLP